MGAGTQLGRNRHYPPKTFIWFLFFPTLHFIIFVLFSWGGGCECKSELFREACVFYFTLIKQDRKRVASRQPAAGAATIGLETHTCCSAAVKWAGGEWHSGRAAEPREAPVFLLCLSTPTYPTSQLAPQPEHQREGTHTLRLCSPVGKWASRTVRVSEN